MRMPDRPLPAVPPVAPISGVERHAVDPPAGAVVSPLPPAKPPRKEAIPEPVPGAALRPVRPREERQIRTKNWDIPHHAEAVGQTRAEVRKALADWGMAVAIDDNVLIVCELVTNALRHGAPGVVLMLAVRDGQVLGMVSDEGNGLPVLRPADDLASHGRGLRMVAELAVEWGVQQHPSGCGKGVWWRWGP